MLTCMVLFYTDQNSLIDMTLAIFQTAGLVGTQAELCAVCHGKRCEQGHVHQEHSGQCAQQQQVGVNVTSAGMFPLHCLVSPNIWQG